MAQTAVPKFYSSRKRLKDPVKNPKTVEKEKLSDILKESDPPTIVAKEKTVKKPSRAKTKGKKVNKITNYLKAEPEENKTIVENQEIQEKCETPRTPKRNLPSPDELTPSKKKSLVSHDATSIQASSPSKQKTFLLTPVKEDSAACKNLFFGSPNRYVSPKKFGSPHKTELTPQKAAVYENLSNKDLASLVNESRSRILFSGRLDELKKSLESFSTVASRTKQFQSNSLKNTSVVSAARSSGSEPVPSLAKNEPAYKKYSFLAAKKSESSLTLPYKYTLLGETFCSLDTVVRMLNNRKERITFEKVKGGVQDMVKRNFLMDHLGQIMSVFPTAYFLHYEKCDSYTINKKSSPYQLMITPNLSMLDGNQNEISSKEDKKNGHSSFIYMTPQHLLERKYHFEQNLLNITKRHHQEYLMRCCFPPVPDEKILRWHPNFPVDSVPHIPVATLPEEPEVKVSTARDVLKKLKGSVRGKVEKALQNVAEEHETEPKEKAPSEEDSKKNTRIKKQNSALRGICTDLLEKIRARESAKIIETMTRSAKDEKRLAMIERLPKIVHILWHYFIAERKAAVPVDVAVEKIIHSFNSLTTPDDVKAHIELIRETMPGWLSIIKVSKGEYITIDKKKDINVMLDNIK